MGFLNFIYFVQLHPVYSPAMAATLPVQVVTILCGLLGLYIFRAIIAYAKLRQFQGPSWTSISNWPHSMAMLRGNCHEWYAEISKKHGAGHIRHLSSFCISIRMPRLPQLTVLIGARTDRPCRASSTDHVFSRSVDASEQQAWLQTLRLVLQSCADRVSEG